ncbi:hypothetical protein JCM10212_006052 [Sporobolomyces blumeae]
MPNSFASSAASPVSPHFWSRRHSLPAAAPSTASSSPTSARSPTSPFSSFASKIATCVDPNGHRVLASRRRYSDTAPPQYAVRRGHVFGFGDESSDDDELEKVEGFFLPEASRHSHASLPPSLVGTGSQGYGLEREQVVAQQGGGRPWPCPRTAHAPRPQLPALVIPPAHGGPRSSSSLVSPTTMISPSVERRREPQPIKTFTPPPPLVPPPPSSGFSSLSRVYSSGYGSSSNKRRSGVLHRAASQSKSSVSKLSRSSTMFSSSSSTPAMRPMQASTRRSLPPSCDVSPTFTFRSLADPPSASSTSSSAKSTTSTTLYPLTPPRSPSSSSNGHSLDPHAGFDPPLSPPTEDSPFARSMEWASKAYAEPRRLSLVSFEPVASPPSLPTHEELVPLSSQSEPSGIGLGFCDVAGPSHPVWTTAPSSPLASATTSRSNSIAHARSATSPPVALDRFRNRHQRSYSEGYPGSRLASSSVSIATPYEPALDPIQKLNLVIANPDVPPIPPKSPLRKLSSTLTLCEPHLDPPARSDAPACAAKPPSQVGVAC